MNIEIDSVNNIGLKESYGLKSIAGEAGLYWDRKPPWLRKKLLYDKQYFATKNLLDELNVNTVCREAVCPNIGECWSRNEATFIILGKNCSRDCRFCNVSNELPETVRPDEPLRIAHAVCRLRLSYVVITSVTRDDLEDKGVGQFVETVKAIKKYKSNTKIELLIPDFEAKEKLIEMILGSGADVIGHNIEMIERLYPVVRPHADYRRSLKVLEILKKCSDIVTKSSIMLGLGEEWNETVDTLIHLRNAGVDIVHIGQYLRPSQKHFPVSKYYSPEEFDHIKNTALNLGFKAVQSGPMVRSSYKARESYYSVCTLCR